MAELGSLSNSKLGNKYVLGELLGFGGFGEVYKAENILLKRPQAIKVILEKHLSDPKFRERFIREAQTLAPEHINGQPQARSDIYALGAVLYQMLVGQPPFTGRTREAIIVKHLMEPPPLLSAKRPDLPPALGLVIEKALAKRLEERYATAGALLQDFHASLAATTRRASKSDDAVRSDDPTRLASVAHRPIVVPTPPRNTPDYPARATPDQQVGREIPSPVARPWYKLGREILWL